MASSAALTIAGYVALAIVAGLVLAWALRRRPRIAGQPEKTRSRHAVDSNVKPAADGLPNPLADQAIRKLLDKELIKAGLNPADVDRDLLQAGISLADPRARPVSPGRAAGSGSRDSGLAERVVSVWRAIQQAQQSGDLQQAHGFVSDRLLAEWTSGASSIPPLPAPGKLIMKIRHRYPETAGDSMTVEVGGVPPGHEADPTIPASWWTFTRSADSGAWVLDRFSPTPPESTAA